MVNIGAIPANAIESVLFGHEKGAFPGAFDRHVGAIQNCDGGTLVLDEIDRLPPAVQERLAEALEIADRAYVLQTGRIVMSGPAREIAAVATGADAADRAASERRTDLELQQTELLDLLDVGFRQQIALLDDDLAGFRIDDVFVGGAAQHALAERQDDFATFDQR